MKRIHPPEPKTIGDKLWTMGEILRDVVFPRPGWRSTRESSRAFGSVYDKFEQQETVTAPVDLQDAEHEVLLREMRLADASMSGPPGFARFYMRCLDAAYDAETPEPEKKA